MEFASFGSHDRLISQQGSPARPETLATEMRLRARALRLGWVLGWPPADVRQFTEDLTGVPWHRCGSAELECAFGLLRGQEPADLYAPPL